MFLVNKKFIIYVFLSFLVFSGCNGNVTTLQSKKTSTEKEDISNYIEETDKIILVYAGNMEYSDQMISIIDEYNKKNDKVLVRYQELPYDRQHMYNQLTKKLNKQSKDMDIIEIDLEWNAEFANKNYSYKLDDFIRNDNFDTNDFMQNSINSVTYKNEIYAIPRNIKTSILYFRKDIINNPPKTWDELIKYSNEFKQDGHVGYGYVFSGKPSGSISKDVLELINSYGGQIFDNNNNISFKKKENIDAINKYYEIYHSNFIPKNIENINDENAFIKFLNGESIFVKTTVLNNDNINNIAIIPNDGKGALLNGQANIISNFSQNKKEAWEFLKFATGYKAQKVFAIENFKIPSLLDVYNDKEVVAINPIFQSKPFIFSINNATLPLKTPYYYETINILENELQMFLKNEKTSEEMMSDFEIKLVEFMSKVEK